MLLRLLLCSVVLAVVPLAAGAGEHTVLLREDFASLDRWKPFFFPKIKAHTTYEIEQDNGASSLRAESNASASAIVYREPVEVGSGLKARWRWKVSNVYGKGDATTKAGDDYPVRVYVMFEYDPEQAGLADRTLYAIAKARFGEYPPHSSLSYVWASKPAPARILSSPYTDKAKMIVLRAGAGAAGSWQDETVDIIADYRQAFGAEPPARARIAIMNDSDNTGERAVSWMDYIEVTR